MSEGERVSIEELGTGPRMTIRHGHFTSGPRGGNRRLTVEWICHVCGERGWYAGPGPLVVPHCPSRSLLAEETP